MGSTSDLEIAKPITLKSGLTLPNRLVKAAMAENMAPGNHLPSEKLLKVYEKWAAGGWGMVLTGNVEVDDDHLGGPLDVGMPATLSEKDIIASFSAYARAGSGSNTPLVMQINHPGRQSPAGMGKRGFFGKTVAPSAVPLSLGTGFLARVLGALIFGTPRELTIPEIEAIVAKFARTARLAAESGFHGVEIHAAHGYLLAQFLSAHTNRRTDAYGGTPEKRARIVVEIVRAIRAATQHKPGFTVGIKLNSVDHQSPEELKDCIEQLRLITEGVDFVEISGGTYEDPQMATGTSIKKQNAAIPEKQKSARTRAREAFFLEFAAAIRSEFPGVPLMVTGGLRSREGMEAAVAGGGCDMVGVGRPAVLNPLLPNNIIFNSELSNQDATLYTKAVKVPWLLKQLGIQMIGAGVETTWYSAAIAKLAKN